MAKEFEVIFTGAGTSQYVGDTAVPYLNEYGDNDHFIFHSFGTTDIVSSPKEFLFRMNRHYWCHLHVVEIVQKVWQQSRLPMNKSRHCFI